MNKSNSITNIGDVYGKMLTEAKDKMTIGDAPLKEGGPQEKGGFKPAAIDKRKKSDKSKDNAYKVDELSNDDTVEEDEETPTKKKNVVVEKIANRSLNKFMAKSNFDKLYENVMGPDFGADSGADAGAPDAGMDDLDTDGLDLDTEGEDEVTVTLDRATAEKLRDVLNSILDVEGEGDGLEDEFGGEGEGEEGEGAEPEWYDEDEETKGAPKPASKSVDNGKNNKVGNLKPAGGGASNAKPTDKVGNDGDYGHALHGAKKPNMGDKNNKVGNYSPGKRLFDK